MAEDEIFDSTYIHKDETKADPKDVLSDLHTEVLDQMQRYELGKPQRIVIRARIIDDQSE